MTDAHALQCAPACSLRRLRARFCRTDSDLSRKHCCWGRGAGRAVGRAKAAEDLRALLMLPSRLALFQELSGLCRLGDLHRGPRTHQEYSVS